MIDLKIINKKTVFSIFLFSLMLNLYLSTISNYELFETYRANSIFARFNIFINTFFILSLLLVVTAKFYKLLNKIETPTERTKSLELIIRRKNIFSTFKIIILVTPFLAWYLVKFFENDDNFRWNITVLVMASLAGFLIFLIFVLFFIYRFIKKVNLLEEYEDEMREVVDGIYFKSIFLDILNFDEENVSHELNDEIHTFLTSKNIENDISFNEELADFLANDKKASTPPSLR